MHAVFGVDDVDMDGGLRSCRQQHRSETETRVVQRATERRGAVSPPVRFRLPDAHLEVVGLTHLGDFAQALAHDGGVEEVGAQGDRYPKLLKLVERCFDEHGLHVSTIGDPVVDRRQHSADVRWGNGHDQCIGAGA